MSITATLLDLPKKRRVYISGRIKDYPEYLRHFERAEEWIFGIGFTPVNPCTLQHKEGATYEDYMRGDLAALLDCGGIYMLKGWEKSAGARCEHLVACMIGLPIAYE